MLDTKYVAADLSQGSRSKRKKFEQLHRVTQKFSPFVFLRVLCG
jgi:hypothetical protein